MLKQLLSSIIFFSLILMISATTALTQVQQYIDTTFGDQGTTAILNRIDINNGYTRISSDSLGNIYISLRYHDGHYSIIKVDSSGTIDQAFQDSELFKRDGFQYSQEDNFIYFHRIIDESTIVDIYDLNLDYIQGYRVPVNISFDNSKYSPTGHFIGLTDEILFKYSADGKLDTSFGNDGIINLQNFIGIFIEEYNRYEFQNENGDHYHTFFQFYPQSNHFLIRLDKNGHLKNTLSLQKTYASFSNQPHLTSHQIQTVTPLQNGQVLISASARQSTTNRSYQFIINEDFSVDRSYGDNGISLIPTGFETRFVTGVFSNNETLLRTNPNAPNNGSIAVIDQAGSLKYDLSDQGLLNLDIKENSFGYKMTIIDKDIYILHLNSESEEMLLSKLRLENIQDGENPSNITADIKTSPNPTSSLIKMLYAGPTLESALLHIYDTNGKLISSKKLYGLSTHQSTEIPIEDMNSGQYILALIYEGQIISTEKMTIVR